jgi:hypothetical protein
MATAGREMAEGDREHLVSAWDSSDGPATLTLAPHSALRAIKLIHTVAWAFFVAAIIASARGVA